MKRILSTNCPERADAYSARFTTPLGAMIAQSDGESLTRLDFAAPAPDAPDDRLPVFDAVARWLDTYFSGREPDFLPDIRLIGSPFQMRVWRMLTEIPFGQTVTYGALAKRLALEDGRARMSAQAVGGAVGRNPVAILVPCHRVVGANGNLTGYAGGMDKKVGLLALEGNDMGRFWAPKSLPL